MQRLHVNVRCMETNKNSQQLLGAAYLGYFDDNLVTCDRSHGSHDLVNLAEDVVSGVQFDAAVSVQHLNRCVLQPRHSRQLQLDGSLRAHVAISRKYRAFGYVFEKTGFAGALATNDDHGWKFVLQFTQMGRGLDAVDGVLEAAERAAVEVLEDAGAKKQGRRLFGIRLTVFGHACEGCNDRTREVALCKQGNVRLSLTTAAHRPAGIVPAAHSCLKAIRTR